MIIFTDAIQQTIDLNKKSFKEVAGSLFKLINGMGARDGAYGMFFGMPITFASVRAYRKERRDILDRLRRQKCFIDRSEMYTQDFPKDLMG